MITGIKTFNFPRNFIKFVEVLNADLKSCVSNYRHMTDWFPLGKRVRHGCPFVLSIELLACKIRQSRPTHMYIKGIDIFGCGRRPGAY